MAAARALGAAVVWWVLAGVLSAQTGASGQGITAQTASAGKTQTIQSRVSLVSLDVVVTDGKGNPVHGLKPEDFTITEDGQRMTPRSFEEHSAASVVTDPGPPVKLPQNVFTNFADVRSHGPLNVLLLDLLNTPLADQAVVRQQMLDYLKNIPAGTQMAVFGLHTQMVMLQGFTSDPAVLKAAVLGMGSKQSQLLRTPQDNDADNEQLVLLSGGDPQMSEIVHDLAVFQAETASEETTIRIEDTLDALDVLARYLEGLPGRKNLIWFSGSFPSILPNLFPQDLDPGIALKNRFGAALKTGFTADVKATSDLLARAQVAVYPIDARGVFTNPAMTVDTSGSSITNPIANGAPARGSSAVAQAFIKSEGDFEKETEEEHGTMDAVADQTGGRAQYDTNGLKGAVASAIANGANYYAMTYAPTNSDWNGGWRKIKVGVDRPGSSLEYRHGYFAVAAKGGGTNGGGGAPTTMEQVMIHGGPNATQIVFRVKVDEAAAMDDTAPKEDKLSEGRMKPPFRHYTVWYAADMRSVGFKVTPDGTYHGLVEYVAKLYNADGDVMDEVGDVAHMNLTADKYQAMLKQGLNVKQEIDAPAKGEFYLRIGVRDPLSDHVGAVEIPLSAVTVEAK